MVIKNLAAAVMAAVLSFLVPATGLAANKPPVIEHQPITIAVKGQPFFVRAVVKDDSGRLKSVKLCYSVSRDQAPFKVPMQDAGTGSWFGSIPENMLAGAGTFSYYIEAMDEIEAVSETPFYDVSVRSTAQAAVARPPDAADATKAGAPASGPGGKPAAATAKPAAGAARDGAADNGRPKWVKPAAIAGGAALLIGGGIALAGGGGGGGGGGDDGGGGGGSVTNFGAYAGSVTTCFEKSGESAVCESHACTITVTASGIVSSDDLRLGQYMETTLAGSDFILVASVNDGTTSGFIRYIGRIEDRRIVGRIEGNATVSGTPGTYSGSFNGTLP